MREHPDVGHVLQQNLGVGACQSEHGDLPGTAHRVGELGVDGHAALEALGKVTAGGTTQSFRPNNLGINGLHGDIGAVAGHDAHLAECVRGVQENRDVVLSTRNHHRVGQERREKDDQRVGFGARDGEFPVGVGLRADVRPQPLHCRILHGRRVAALADLKHLAGQRLRLGRKKETK